MAERTPAYMNSAYDFIDLLDRIALQNPAGRAWAQTLASSAISSAAAYFPRAAKAVLGDQRIATHKSAAANLPARLKEPPAADVIDQALDRGRQTATEAAKLGPDSAIAKEIDQFFAALAQKYGVAGSVGGGSTLSDSGDQSKPATKTTKPTLNDWMNSAAEQMRRNGGYH